jgi:hypothetical protein
MKDSYLTEFVQNFHANGHENLSLPFVAQKSQITPSAKSLIVSPKQQRKGRNHPPISTQIETLRNS